MTANWDPDFFQRSPMFAPLQRYGRGLRRTDWPALADLQRTLDTCKPPLHAQSGARLAFVPQQTRSRHFEDRYEVRVYLKGEVQLRERNWHDLFNALVWMAFPRTKAALNARHYHAMLEQRAAGAANRGPLQDALTLFDEGGVIVAAADAALLRRIERFEWKTLFWHERDRVVGGMRFYLFGHALYEKALAPFTGITARALMFCVDPAILQAPLEAQLEALDTLAASRIADERGLRSPHELAPVPILGIPGWAGENERESYYDDTAYFRGGRTPAKKSNLGYG